MPGASPFVLGSDMGTSSCKTVLLDANARVVAAAVLEYPSYHPQPGWVEQDPAEWYRAFCQTVRQNLDAGVASPADIAAVCIVGVTHNPVLLGEHGQLLRPAIHFWDQRSAPQVQQLKARWGDEVRARTLNEVDPLWTWPQLAWIRQHEPHLWAQVAGLVFTKDYVRRQLISDNTDSLVSDTIDPVGTLLYDPRSSSWIEAFVTDLGLPPSALPAVQPPLAIAGEVSAQGAQDSGLRPGTPVLTGTTDTAAEVLGAGGLENGQAILKLASVGRIMLVMDQPLDDPHSLNYPHILPGLWYPGSVTKHAAGAYRWARQALWPDLGSDGAYQVMDAAAVQIVPGSGGLLFHPHLSGEYAPQWDPALRASFTGLSVLHSRDHLTRAVLEGVACQMRSALEQITAAGGYYREIRLIGGGANSSLWAEIMAAVLDQELLIPAERSAAYGAGLLAGMSAGLYPRDAGELGQLIAVAQTFHPDPAYLRLYQHLYETYQEVDKALDHISQRIEQMMTNPLFA